jgi:hypothetical protein
MADSALYFPYIDLPRDDSLLGSCCIGIIWERSCQHMAMPGQWTVSLIDAGLVVPIQPTEYIHDDDEFLDEPPRVRWRLVV